MSDELQTIGLARLAADERTPENERTSAALALAKRLVAIIGAPALVSLNENGGLSRERRGAVGTEIAKAFLRLIAAGAPPGKRKVKLVQDPALLAEVEKLRAEVAKFRPRINELEQQVIQQQNALGMQSAQLVSRDNTITRLEGLLTQSRRDVASIHQALSEEVAPTSRRRR